MASAPSSPPVPPPAALLRRMQASSGRDELALSVRPDDTPARATVEAARGRIVLRLDPPPSDDVAVQWTQNGRPIAGQTGPALHLAHLAPDDADLYFATLTSPAGERRSQGALVIVTPGHPLTNYSARGQVSPGHPLIVGFVVDRTSPPGRNKRYLVRVIGPSLRQLGIAAPLDRAAVSLHRRQANLSALLQRDLDFVRTWAPKVGAFALLPDSTEFVAVAELPPGPYSVVVTGEADTSGEALIEIYETSA